MNRPANPARGEAQLPVAGAVRVLRPSFAALVAAEDELGPLFALVERAGAGQLRLDELAALFWHCLSERQGLSREDVGEAGFKLRGFVLGLDSAGKTFAIGEAAISYARVGTTPAMRPGDFVRVEVEPVQVRGRWVARRIEPNRAPTNLQ